MKRFFFAISIMVGYLLFGVLAHDEIIDTKRLTGILFPALAAAQCPSCSGDAPVVQNTTFEAGTDCECSGTTSLTVGPNVTVKNTATATFISPAIIINAITIFEQGSVVNLLWIKEPISITLTADPTSITADGITYSIITAIFKDGDGNPVPKGTALLFATDLGTFPDDSQVFSINTYDDTGTIATFLRAGTTPGTATVSATLGGTTQQVQVTICNSDTATLTVKALPTTLPADGSSTSSITATAENGAGSPVPDGTIITFTATYGTLSSGTATTANGVATVTYTAPSSKPAGGSDTITAEAPNGVNGNATITLWTSGTDTLTVKAVPSTLTADGTSTSSITATAKNGAGNPVPDGTIITFTAEHGTLSSGTATTTSGVAIVTYTAPSSKPADGSDSITAEAPSGVNGGATITLTGPTIGTVVLSASPDAIPANGTSTAAITATVTVEGGASAPAGVVVTFTIISGGGTFTGGVTEIQRETNDSGIAVAILTSDTQAGTATIGATADGVTAQEIEVTYEPGSLTLTIVPNSVLATGEEEAEVSVLVKDADGDPVANQQVDLTLSDATLGSLDDSHPTTDANGEATVTFTAGSKGGTVTITATWDSGGTDVTGTGAITIQPPPAFIEIVEGFPNPQKINIRGTGGQGTSEIKFVVKDSQGNLVDAGYRIDFSIITGPNGGENLIPASTRTVDGGVGGLLYSGFKSGPVSIRATYHHDTSVNTTTSQIVIVGGPAVGEAFGVSAQYVNISGIYLAGLHDPITANAADRYGNAISDNTAISFKTYNTGGFFATGTAVTTNGVASDDLVSGGTYLTPLNGFVSVTTEVVGGNTTHVSCIAVTPSPDVNIIYAGTNGGGVYKSMNSGATWKNISRSTENPKQGQNWIDPYVKGNSAICVDPDDHNTVYVGTGYLGRGNVYRSLDGGMNWNSNDIEEWNGIFSINAAVLSVLCDGNSSQYVWIGTEGQGAWYSDDDGENFTRSADLGYGKTVTEIVKVPGLDGSAAILYAATPTGVFKSTDGGQNWTETAEKFTNDIINTLILHPTSTAAGDHLLYVGTEAAGVWFSTDGGAADPWTQYYPNGMGEGLSATVPVPDVNNEGNGVMSDVTVGADTQSEFWTVTYDATSGEFQVTGTVSGSQANAAVDQAYTIANVLSFTIFSGSIDFEDGDSFTFTTTRDPSRTIKDLLIDPRNHRLYALTYFFGPLEPYHAVGNIYVIELDSVNEYEPTGNWTEANSGLPGYAPPRDTTLFPQYALATDNPSDAATDPSWFLIGGEGINMYKAKSGFDTGVLPWQVSKSGLSNLIMARMPVLFSGNCSMTVNKIPLGSDKMRFEVYIEDLNGNPPVAGSTFEVWSYDYLGIILPALKSKIYPDVHTSEGTFSNPADAGTDDPYVFEITGYPGSTTLDQIVKVEFIFTPLCEDTVPGCSGSLWTDEYRWVP